MLIWEKIKKQRLRENLSQSDVALYLEISQPAYHKIECGKTKLTLERLEQLAKLFGIEISELLR